MIDARDFYDYDIGKRVEVFLKNLEINHPNLSNFGTYEKYLEAYRGYCRKYDLVYMEAVRGKPLDSHLAKLVVGAKEKPAIVISYEENEILDKKESE